MATAKQVVYTPVDMSDAEYSEFEPDAKMEEENAEFEQFKTEMHDAQFDAKITVGKKLTDSNGRPLGRQIFECFECGVDDYTFSQLCTRIREDFGTGLYQIQGRDSKGKYKFKKTVGILAPNQTDNEPRNDAALLIDKFSDAMQRQQMATEQMFLKLSGPQTGGDAIDQIVKIAGAIAPVLAALGISRPEPAPPKTLVDQLAEVKMIQELMGGNNDTQYGEANGWSALTETLKALGPAIGGALAMGTTAPATPDAVPQIAAPIPEELPSVDAAPEHEKILAATREALQKQIGMLLIQAKGGANPLEVAEMVVNMTPPEHEEKLWDTISDENCVGTMIEAVAEVSEHRAWFDALRLGIIDLMAEPIIDAEQERENILSAAKGATPILNPTKENPDPHLQNSENADTLPESPNGENSPAVVGVDSDIDGTDGDTTGTT